MKCAWSSRRGVDPCGQAAAGKEQPDRGSGSSAGRGVLTVSPEASGDAGKLALDLLPSQLEHKEWVEF